jgi:pimeloyl-ACP methyl ester carboxylesterase
MIRSFVHVVHHVIQVVAPLLLLFSTAAWSAPTAFTVEVTGQGKPIILIPGMASSGEVWKATVARYCGRFQCHVLTLAGFAGVPPIGTPLLPSTAKQVVEYIDARHLDRPALVGHSLGGFLALRIAADDPDKVGRIVVVDALPALGATQVPDITAEQLKGMAARMRASMQGQDAETYAAGQRRSIATMVTGAEDLERIVGWGRQSDRATVVNAMHDLFATDLRGDLARIKAPTLVLGTWIAFKDFAPRSAIEATFRSQYRNLDGVRIELADKARHFIMYDDPQWMYERMDAFLD